MIGIPDIDEKVVIKAKEKDEEAITEIIKTIDNSCYTIVYNCLGANKKYVNDVEDIIQNAYIKAFSRIDSLKDNHFSAWFYTVLEREVIDYTRTAYVKNKPIEFSQVDCDAFNETYEDTIENNNKAFEPKANVDYEELKQGILDCINQLPEMQRTAIYLHYIEKRKISEIAQMYETKENTVKSWLSYGRKGMRDILEKLEKQNKSFYGISIIPFFIWMFSEEVQRATVVKAAEIAHQAIAYESSKTIGVAETSKGVVAASQKKGLITTMKVAAKPLFTTIQTKAVALTMAGVVATGVGAGVVKTMNQTSDEKDQVETVKADQKDEIKQEHTHTWEPVYEIVHHDAEIQTLTILDQAAYDEPVYSTRTVKKIGVNDRTFDTKEEADAYVQQQLSQGNWGSTGLVDVEEQYQSGTIHHDAITHQEQVVVKEAYDEEVLTGYTCSCGETKEK